MTTRNKNCQECDDCDSNAAQVMPPQNENNCPQPNPCTTATRTACVFHQGDNVVCGTDIIIEDGNTQEEINARIIEHFCGIISELEAQALTIITYAQSETLVADSEVEVGGKYLISDRGIIITGVATNLFSVEGQRFMRVVKHAYYDNLAPSIGVWYSTISPNADDVVIWGGKVWKNLTGSAGSADDEYTLSAFDWELIPTTNNTYYQTRSFFVHYDHARDWVAKQFDWKGNEFGISWSNADDLGLAYNPVDISDWGSEFIIENKAAGIYNNAFLVLGNRVAYPIYENFVVIGNTNEGAIFNNTSLIIENVNRGEIHSNTNSQQIIGNSNGGDIQNNSNNGSISYNSNGGIISDNINEGSIEYNSNRAGIISNANDGDIAFNNNNGNILLNTSNVNNIQYNNNNGDVRDNSCSSSINYNSNAGSIRSNSNSGGIFNNTNAGIIQNNENTGNIQRNSNNDYIFENSNVGAIEDNSNNGKIEGNSNNGFISFNKNNGHIGTIGATTTNITKNNNNGNIVTTVVGVISDSIVNK
jgi:hypothetical protein